MNTVFTRIRHKYAPHFKSGMTPLSIGTLVSHCPRPIDTLVDNVCPSSFLKNSWKVPGNHSELCFDVVSSGHGHRSQPSFLNALQR